MLQRLFEQIAVPVEVQDEVLRTSPDVPGIAAIRAAFAEGLLTVRAVEDRATFETLTAFLDGGEAAAIALTKETKADVLLLDERRARVEAQRLGIPVVGTIGILRRGRERGLLSAVAPIVDELRQLGFWISAELLDEIRREEGGPTSR